MPTYEEIANKIMKSTYFSSYLSQINFKSEEEKHDFLRDLITTTQGYKRHPNNFYVKKEMPNEYVVIDLETTGFSNQDEIIQLSAEKIKNHKVIDSFDKFVKPQSHELTTQIMYLTGITNDSLQSAPSINDVRDSFVNFIKDMPVLGHNISFDARFLRNANIQIEDVIFCDTCEYAKTKQLDVENYKLSTLKDYFGIPNTSHNALSDCDTTYQIFEKLFANDLSKHIENQVIPQIFEKQKFCVTGSFKEMTRDQIKKAIISRGGKIMSGVTKNTNYFVDGAQVAKNLTDGVHSGKELAYEDLVAEGVSIKKLTEDEFIQMLDEVNDI